MDEEVTNTLCCNPFVMCMKADETDVKSKKKSTIFAYIVMVLQEFIAVTFQLVCLSRIETTTDFMKPLLVLFLTLVIFTGPYLNAWLLFTEYIIFKRWWIWQNSLILFYIAAAHVVGSVSTGALVNGMAESSTNIIIWDKKKTITWNIIGDDLKNNATWNNNQWHVHLIEEIIAVSCLLIGWAYLLWLRKMRNAKQQKKNPKGVKIEIKFYMQLTLLVAAVSQTFPSAQLSPHILSYRLYMQTITIPEFLSRLFGGLIGLGLGCLWCLFRDNYRVTIQEQLDPEHEHNLSVYQKAPSGSDHEHIIPSFDQKPRMQIPQIRLSMHGGSYY